MKHMKNFRTVILVVVLAVLLALGVLGGILAVKADAAQDYPLKIWKQNENDKYKTFVVIDDATGVNYVVVSSTSLDVAITPRLNADGSLYVNK